MQTGAMSRKILIAIDNSDASESCVKWIMAELVSRLWSWAGEAALAREERPADPTLWRAAAPALQYKPGDELHLLHVVPRLQLASTYGAPPVDFLPYQASAERRREALVLPPAGPCVSCPRRPRLPGTYPAACQLTAQCCRGPLCLRRITPAPASTLP